MIGFRLAELLGTLCCRHASDTVCGAAWGRRGIRTSSHAEEESFMDKYGVLVYIGLWYLFIIGSLTGTVLLPACTIVLYLS